MILVILLYALLASTFTIGKALLLFTPPFYLIGLRMTIAGAFLLGFHYFFSKGPIKLKGYDWLLLTVFSLIHIFIPYTTEFIAMQTVAPSCAALMYNLSPFFTALFAYIFLQETMTPLKWFGFSIGLAGIVYFINPASWCLNDIGFDSAYALLMISVISASLGWVLVKVFVKSHSMSIIFINGYAMLVGGLCSFGASMYVQEKTASLVDQPGIFWLLLSLIILTANVLFYNLYGHLLKKYTATLLSFVGCVTPLFTAFYDRVFLGMQVESNFYVALIMVSFGIYLFYKEELKREYH